MLRDLCFIYFFFMYIYIIYNILIIIYRNEDSRHSHSCSDHRLLAAVLFRTDSLMDTMAFSLTFTHVIFFLRYVCIPYLRIHV